MGGLLDRYLFRGVALRFLAVAGIVIVMLSLENVARLAADVEQSDAPLELLGRLSLALIPEHLSAAIPIALLLGVALTVRQMALRGEWQILPASGMSRGRAMAGPLAVAMLAAGLLLADRLELRPAGLRSLDATYLDLKAGRLGVPLPVGQAVPLDEHTTAFVSAVGADGRLAGVLVRRGAQSYAAPSADISRGANGGIILTLLNGTSIAPQDDGSIRRLSYATMRIAGHPPMIALTGNDFRHRLDRASAGGLLRLSASPDRATGQAAFAALAMRVDAALFCLAVPWMALVLGMPARRRTTGAGLAIGILLMVAHLKTAVLVEDLFATWIVAAELVHLACWAGIAFALLRLETRYGEGFAERGFALAIRAIAGLRTRLTTTRFPVLPRFLPAAARTTLWPSFESR